MCAEVAHILHTPIPDLMDLDIEDLVAWHNESRRIVEGGGAR